MLTAELAAVGATALLEAIREVDRADPLLPGVVVGDLRRAGRDRRRRESTPLDAADAVRRREGVRALHHALLPAPLRAARVLRDPLQPQSPRRPLEFVPRKIAHAAAAIKLGLHGRAAARRPVRATRLGLRRRLRPRRVADAAAGRARRLRASRRGETHSVEELVSCAFGHVGLDWREYVRIDESLKRGKAELHDLVGDPARARERLGWQPEVSFDELVRLLVDAELEQLCRRVSPSSSRVDRVVRAGASRPR